MPHWIRNNIPDFLRATSVKIAVKSGKICYETTMGERQRIGEGWIVDKTDGFRLDPVMKSLLQTGQVQRHRTLEL